MTVEGIHRRVDTIGFKSYRIYIKIKQNNAKHSNKSISTERPNLTLKYQNLHEVHEHSNFHLLYFWIWTKTIIFGGEKKTELKKTVGITIPCHSKCRHQCDREQWRGSWFGPHRPAAEPPARPLSPVAYWVPRPPQLFYLFIVYANRSTNQNHTHPFLGFLIYM